MTALSHDDGRDDDETCVSRPILKPSLKSLLARLAIGQILREEYVYEVHGPFVAELPATPQPRLAAWMIAKLTR